MEQDLRVLGRKFKDKLGPIKVVLFDIDGILTNGLIHWDGMEVGYNRATHAQDGYGMKLLMDAGIKVGVISGGDSLGVKKRFEENLKLDFVFLGNEDKRKAYLKVIDLGYEDKNILYMGDELFDIPLLKRAGFSATVPNAGHEVREAVDYVTMRKSGQACAREVMDILRYAKGIIPIIPTFANL